MNARPRAWSSRIDDNIAGSVGLAASFGQADITHDVIGIAEALSGLSVAHEVMSVSKEEGGRSPSWWSTVPCAKNRRKRSERVVARRFQGPLKGLGQAGTGASGGGGRPRAASHRRVLYAGSGSGAGSGRGRGWGWGSCGHISRRWVQWWVMWLVVNM